MRLWLTRKIHWSSSLTASKQSVEQGNSSSKGRETFKTSAQSVEACTPKREHHLNLTGKGIANLREPRLHAVCSEEEPHVYATRARSVCPIRTKQKAAESQVRISIRRGRHAAAFLVVENHPGSG